MTELVKPGLPSVELSPERIESLEKKYQLDIIRTVVYGGKAYRNLLTRRRREFPERFEGVKHLVEGLRFAEWMKRSDGAVNNYVKILYDTTLSGETIKLAMEDPLEADHGFPHIRRDEEWVEAAILRDKEIRHSKLPYKFWLPAVYLAIRNHDVIQLLNGEKDYHAELAALFTLASYKQVAQAFGVKEDLAYAYCQFAAMMILEHTSVPVTQASSTKELFDKLGHVFEQYMPEVIKKDFAEEFALLREDSRPLQQNFAKGSASHKVFKKYSSLFSMADKFDTLYPAELASLRTLVVSAAGGRALYVEPEILAGIIEISLEDELDYYEKKSEWWDRSDTGRKLHEFKRPLPLVDNDFLTTMMKINKLAAIKKLGRLYTRLMAKDKEVITEIFEERRDQVKAKIFSRAGIESPSLEPRLSGRKRKLLKEQLNKHGGALKALEKQRQKLLEIVDKKMADYSQEQIAHVQALFDLLYQQELLRQGKKAEEVGEIEEFLPYGYYDSIAVLEDMRCNTLVSGKRIR